MNTIKKIRLTQFRNYTSSSFDFVAPITCIAGPNGSGKTNLLDAIYYLCYTKSYFSSNQQNSVQKGYDGFRVEGVFSKDEERVEVISCKWKNGKKEITADAVEYDKLTDHIGKYAAVMIAPDDIEIVNDGSEVRRKWMDGILGQIDKQYLESLMQYQRVLLQRNSWLKLNALHTPANSIELEYYDAQLSYYAGYIYRQRTIFIQRFSSLLTRYYHQLSSGKETINICYKSDLHQKSLDVWLKEGLQHDVRLQRTLRGIHKDDLEFAFNEIDLKQFGSQGQKKSYLFALKLAQYSYLSKELGYRPILLLDDIFEKLDQSRIEALLHIIRSDNFRQVVITDSHADRVMRAFGETASIDFIKL